MVLPLKNSVEIPQDFSGVICRRIGMNLKKIASFFESWEETMIWSCLQGCMGEIIPDDLENPKAAMLTLGVI